MTRSLRIGLLTPAWPGATASNGIVTSILHLSGGLVQLGHRPVILAMRPDGTAPDMPEHVYVNRGEWSVWDKLRARVIGNDEVRQQVNARRIVEAIGTAHAREPLDALIVEDSWGWSAGIRQATGLPTIVSLRGPWFMLHNLKRDAATASDKLRIKLEAKGYTAASGLMAPSRSVLDAVLREVPQGSKPAAVIPNAISMEKGPPAAEQAGDILFVGRFDGIKGGDTVLEAAAILAGKLPGTRLVFVGPDRGVPAPGGRMCSLAEALDALDPAARAFIDWRDQQPRAEVAALRKTHPIALIASRYETFGNVALEAMAAGQAIVATRVGGLAEILEHEETALLIPPEDGQAMADALARLQSDAALRTRLGRAAQRRIEEVYSPAQVAAEVARFVEEVLETKPECQDVRSQARPVIPVADVPVAQTRRTRRGKT